MRNILLFLVCAVGAFGQENVIADGTRLAVQLDNTVKASHARAGDAVEATLYASIVSHGVVVVPARARILGHVLVSETKKTAAVTRLLIRFDEARWHQGSKRLNAFVVRQLVVKRSVTAADTNNNCPGAMRFLFQRRVRDRDPLSQPQVPVNRPLPCQDRVGATTALALDRIVFSSPPLKDISLVRVASPAGATMLVSHKKDLKLARGTILELRQAGE